MLALLPVLAVAACVEEDRTPDPPPSSGQPNVVLSHIAPGGEGAAAPADPRADAFERSAYHVSQGQRLFTWFNCVGCHGHGGGGSGPPLMDDQWIYGGATENIVATITEGRPNGMPSFGQQIPEEQIWELAAYIRSMTRQVPRAAAPTRTDDLMPGEGEARRPPQPPLEAGNPATSDGQQP